MGYTKGIFVNGNLRFITQQSRQKEFICQTFCGYLKVLNFNEICQTFPGM